MSNDEIGSYLERVESGDDGKSGEIKASCGRKMRKSQLMVALTLLGVAFGIVLGIGLRLSELSASAKTLVTFAGEILLRGLKMLAIPLISTSVVTAVADLCKSKSGRVGLHIAVYYLSTTVCAVCIGIGLSLAIKPGVHGRIDGEGNGAGNSGIQKSEAAFSAVDNVLDLIRNMFPSNLVAAWFRSDYTKTTVLSATNDSANSTSNYAKSLETVDGSNTLGLMTFCVALGLSIGRNDSPGNRFLYQLTEALFSAFLDIMMAFMWYAPIGICSLIAGNLVQVVNMVDTLKTLGLYIATLVLGVAIHVLVIYSAIYFVATRKNPLRVFAGSLQAVLMMVGVSSSAATLPVTIRCAEENLKIEKRFTRLVLPLGATINMDGTAILQGIVALTIAQMNGITLSIGQMITVCVTGSLAAIGAATTPGTGLVVVLFVVQSVGLPVEALGLLYTVDWLLERIRSPVNVLGDIVGVCVVAHLNRESHEDAITKQEQVPLDGSTDLIDHAKVCC